MKVGIQAVDSSKKPVFEFASPTVTIGRDSGCDLAMTGTTNVSSRHTQIELTPEGAFLVDLKSTNGTFLNDRRLDGRKKLRKGDFFRLGQTGPCFQVVELDITGSAPCLAVGGTLLEKATRPRYGAPDKMPPVPKAKSKPVPEAPDPLPVNKPTPVAASGQTRLMVVELQKKNRKLMIGVFSAVAGLLLLGGVAVLYLKTGGVEKDVGQKISDKLRKSTVWINSPDGMSGSGMLVNAEEKIVVTNYHVVARPRSSPMMEAVGVLAVFDFDIKAKLYAKVHPLRFPAKIIQIELHSPGFDSQVGVENAKGQLLAVSDRGKMGRKARVLFSADYDGDYRVLVIGRGIGNYKLAVSEIIHDVHPLVDANFAEYADGKAIVETDHYVKLLTSDKEKYKAKVIAWSDAKDLAVLKLNYIPKGVGAVPLAKESARSGQDVHSIGNPGSSKFLWIYTKGDVRTADANRAKYPISLPGSGVPFLVDAWIIETQSPTNPGDSGGPVVNDHGELVAVTHAGDRSAQLATTFIDVREVRTLLKDKNIRWQEK